MVSVKEACPDSLVEIGNIKSRVPSMMTETKLNMMIRKDEICLLSCPILMKTPLSAYNFQLYLLYFIFISVKCVLR